MRALITEYGAVGDGQSLNTQAIQKAVDDCHDNGGGTVIVPQGVFISGTVELKSNVTLHIEQGGVLKGSENIADYREIGYYFKEIGEVTSLLYGMNSRNVLLTGEGLVDFSGAAFMDYSKPYNINMLPEDATEEQRNEEACGVKERVKLPVFFHQCEHMAVRGLTFIESPCWTITFSSSRNIKISGITILNNLKVPNSDGIHLCGCKDAIITDCVLSCADDCIAITSVADYEEISERIIVSNCTMRSRSSGLRLGHHSSKVKDVVASNLTIYESNRGLCVFANVFEDNSPGWVKNAIITNVVMDTHIYAGSWWGKGEPLVISGAGPGRIENITVSHVKASSENSVLVIGEGHNVRGITLQDWDIQLHDSKNRPYYTKKLDVVPNGNPPAPNEGRSIPWIVAQEVADLRLSDIRYAKASAADFEIEAVISDVAELDSRNVQRR